MTLRILATVLTVMVFGSSFEARAEPAASDAPAKVAAPLDPFAQAMAARKVAEFARRQKDPQAMLTAARMLQEIPVTGASDADDAAFTPAGLFTEARGLARGDTLLLQQISVAESTGSRGVMSSAFGSGLVRIIHAVSPGAAYQFTVNAKGGEPLRIGAIGDVGTSLALRMVDAGGKTVCLDDNGDYAPVCQLMPRSARPYRVDILNKSAAQSRTVILSN